MNPTILRSAVVLGLWAGSARAAEPPSPELLAKLAEQEARVIRALNVGAYTVRTSTEELDGDGKLQHTRQAVVRVSNPGGKRTVRVEKVVLDGKDVTEEERQKQREQKDRRMESPFAASAREKYRYELLGPDPADSSRVRIHFEPREKERSSSTYIGEAVVDVAAGEVVRMWERPAENPPFVDRLELQVELGAQTPMGRQLSSLKVEGKGGLLFYKKGFRAQVAFFDYDVGATPSR